ncbi:MULTISPECIES: putative holin-like toxin [Paenibacillus]
MRGGGSMSTYETLILMISFATLIVLIIRTKQK